MKMPTASPTLLSACFFLLLLATPVLQSCEDLFGEEDDGLKTGAMKVKLGGDSFDTDSALVQYQSDKFGEFVYIELPLGEQSGESSNGNPDRFVVKVPQSAQEGDNYELGRQSDASLSLFQGGITYSTAYFGDTPAGNIEITRRMEDTLSGDFEGNMLAFDSDDSSVEVKNGRFKEVPLP
jgi:hypothetical protein